jgi:hypothetical protein
MRFWNNIGITSITQYYSNIGITPITQYYSNIGITKSLMGGFAPVPQGGFPAAPKPPASVE